MDSKIAESQLPKGNPAQRNSSRWGAAPFSRNLIYILTAILFGTLSLTKNQFIQFKNIYALLYYLSIEFPVVVGMTYLLILGEVDLSVGSLYALSGAMSGYLIVLSVPVWLSVLIALLVTGIIGLANGLLVSRLKINSIILTLGTMIMIRGVVNIFVQRLGGYPYPSAYKMIARFKLMNQVHLTIIFMIVLLIILELLLNKHTLFKKMVYVGENVIAARVYGVNADRIKLWTFSFSGLFAGIAGIFSAALSGQTVFNTGVGLEFRVVTAVLLGGASLFGGRASILKSTFGLFFLSLVANGMVMNNIDPEFQAVTVGTILILAVFVDSILSSDRG